MRTILLAGAAVLALGVGGAFAAPTNNNGSGNSGNNNGNTSVPINVSRSGNTQNSHNSTTVTDSGNKLSVPISIPGQIQTSRGAQNQGSGQAASDHSLNVDANLSNVGNSSDSRNQSSSADNGSASATNGGRAESTNVTTGDIAALTDCGCQLAYGNLSDTNTHTTNTTVTVLAHSENHGAVFGAAPERGAGLHFGGDNTMRGSVNGQGILTAQQNLGMNSMQQNSVALGSIVGGNGGGISGLSR